MSIGSNISHCSLGREAAPVLMAFLFQPGNGRTIKSQHMMKAESNDNLGTKFRHIKVVSYPLVKWGMRCSTPFLSFLSCAPPAAPRRVMRKWLKCSVRLGEINVWSPGHKATEFALIFYLKQPLQRRERWWRNQWRSTYDRRTPYIQYHIPVWFRSKPNLYIWLQVEIPLILVKSWSLRKASQVMP